MTETTRNFDAANSDAARNFKAAANTLAQTTHGPVHVPGTEGYEEERTGFQRLVTHRPALVVAATGERDVRGAVEFAAAHDAQVAVQATGHGLNTEMEGGVLISTAGMSRVRVDPTARTAWVEAGASWRQVIDAAAPHGLAPLSGSLPGVGAVSYTLGGGIGLLARRYGFAADHVRGFELVTADARAHRVTETEQPDLFWALRGGGGNFGVVTSMEIDLMPVTRIYGGGLYFDVERVPEVLDAWRRWTAAVPEEMTSAVSMLPFPDLPMAPEALRGKHVAQVQISYLGSTESGARLVEPLRALGPRLLDTLSEVPYIESGAVFNEPDEPHGYRSTNLLLRDLGPDGLDSLTQLTSPAEPVMSVVGIRHLGGALARGPQVSNAIGHRDAEFSLGILSPAQPTEDEMVRALHREALRPWAGQAMGPALNFTFSPLDEHEVRSAFAPQDYRRLTEIKTRHDPSVLFRCNHPIPPVHS